MTSVFIFVYNIIKTQIVLECPEEYNVFNRYLYWDICVAYYDFSRISSTDIHSTTFINEFEIWHFGKSIGFLAKKTNVVVW